MKYVVIGFGVAGVAAMEAIRSEDNTGEITLISDDPHGYYSRPGLAYYLTGELHDKALYPKSSEDFRRLKFTAMRGRVTKILPGQKRFVSCTAALWNSIKHFRIKDSVKSFKSIFI